MGSSSNIQSKKQHFCRITTNGNPEQQYHTGCSEGDRLRRHQKIYLKKGVLTILRKNLCADKALE